MVERTVTAYLKGDISDFNRKMLEASAGAKAFTNSLDTSTDRVANLTQSVLALGPALIPITASATPAVAGLANQLGIGAAAAGVAVLAFKGLGKALDAVNNASIDPTTANVEKMQEVLGQLGPAGQDFVLFLQRARPQLQQLQELSRAGMFPGLEAGLHSLTGLLPDVERIITTISTTLGDLASEAGNNLDSPKWHEFIAFLDSEARPTLLAMGRTAGNFAEGLANLWMAFAPLENNFSQSFLGLARDFAKWTDGLDQTQGFQDFIAYVDRVGPKAFDTLGSLANALLQIVEAAAPVGEVSLPFIKAFADATATLADSNLGPLVIGVVALTSAYARLIALGKVANTGTLGTLFGKSTYGGAASAAKDLPAATRAYFDFGAALDSTGPKVGKFASTSERLGASLRGGGRIAAGVGGLALVMSGLDDKIGLTNTVMGAMIGSTIPGFGTAIGAAVGAVIDLTHQTAAGATAVKAFQDAFGKQDTLAGQTAVIKEYRDEIASLQEAQSRTSGPVKDAIGDSIKTLQAGLEPLVQQHKANALAAQDQQFKEAGLADAMSGASQATRDETQAMLNNISAKNQAADATENAFSAETNYRQALKDADKQARTNNAGIDGNSDAALANRNSLDQLVTAWNRVADAGNATGKDLKNARANFIRVAHDMGVSTEAAGALFDSLRHLPAKTDLTVNLDGEGKVRSTVTRIQKVINGVHGKTVYVNVVHTNSYGSSITGGGRTGTSRADGGLILGPGGPRDDVIPAWLSNGEFVVNAAATKAHLGLLHTINSRKFADGGPVLQSMAPSGYLGPANYGWGGGGTTADIAAAVREGVRQGQREAFDGVSFEMSSDNRYLKTKVRRG